MNAEEKLKEIMEAFEEALIPYLLCVDEPEGMVTITMSKTLTEKWLKEIKEILK